MQQLSADTRRSWRAFSSGGEVVVKALSSSESVVIQVRDSGEGIAPTDRERLFEPLTQLDDSTTRAHRGLGMGLSTARAIARAMQGDITLESEVGKGSVFTVRLPLRMDED